MSKPPQENSVLLPNLSLGRVLKIPSIRSQQKQAERAVQGLLMRVQITNRRQIGKESEVAFGDNIFREIHDVSTPRAILPSVKLSDTVDVYRPVSFQCHGPETVSKTTPKHLRGVGCLCFSAQVMTPSGAMAIENLNVGDRVLTRDNGFQTLRWAGVVQNDAAIPTVVEIQSNAIDSGIPSDVLTVSGRQKVLLTCPGIADQFGTREVLARAGDLLHLDGVRQVEMQTGFKALLFDNHEILRVNDAWLDSFLPDREALSHFDTSERNEVLEHIPALKDLPIDRSYPSARSVLRSEFARQFQREAR